MKLTTFEQLSEAYGDWRGQFPLNEAGTRNYQDQRFGQYLWTRFDFGRLTWPELFYQEDPGEVIALLVKEYEL
jgi:hypothetical protein